MKKMIIHAMISALCIAPSTINASESPHSGANSEATSPFATQHKTTPFNSPPHSPGGSRQQDTPLVHVAAIKQLTHQEKKKQHESHDQAAVEKFAANLTQQNPHLEEQFNIDKGLNMLYSDTELGSDHTPTHSILPHVTATHRDGSPVSGITATSAHTPPATPRHEKHETPHISGFASGAHGAHSATGTHEKPTVKAAHHDSTLAENLKGHLSKAETAIEHGVSKVEDKIKKNKDKGHDKPSKKDASHKDKSVVTTIKDEAHKVETTFKEETEKIEKNISGAEKKVVGEIKIAVTDVKDTVSDAKTAEGTLSWWQKNASSLKIAGVGVSIAALIALLYHFNKLPAGMMQKLDSYLSSFLTKSTSTIHK